MDTRNGNIRYLKPGMKVAPFEKEMVLPLTVKQKQTMKVGRNDPCPCGSGLKFKKCCLRLS